MVVVHIDLAKATGLAMNSTMIKAKFFDPSSRASGMGGTIKASITEKVQFELDGTSLNIISSSFMKGMINYVIPVLDKDSFNCKVEKVQP
jgi:hypothetical protein